MHPLLHLVTREPSLLAEHAEAYADLIGDEIGAVSLHWRRRALLTAVALCCAGVGAVLAGVAVLFWAAIPLEHMPAPWALLVTPLVPLVAALGCGIAARSGAPQVAFEQLRQQLRDDVAMFKEASAS